MNQLIRKNHKNNNKLYVSKHCSITSQHVGRPTNRKHRLVHFSPGTIVPKLNTTLRIQNKISHRHCAAKIVHGALDFAATAHFLPLTYRGTDHQNMTAGIRVGCANGIVMHAVATDKLSLEALPDRACDCHKFTDITLPLVSGLSPSYAIAIWKSFSPIYPLPSPMPPARLSLKAIEIRPESSTWSHLLNCNEQISD